MVKLTKDGEGTLVGVKVMMGLQAVCSPRLLTCNMIYPLLFLYTLILGD